MITTIQDKKRFYKIDLSKPLDISITLRGTSDNVNAWYITAPKIEPVTDGDWIGKVSEGASTNFNNIHFNPHGHGTHTECVGHITTEFYSINDTLKQFFFTAELISINPEKKGEDSVITKSLLQELIHYNTEALVIRTLPNSDEKISKQHSHTNWPYLSEDAAIYIRELGIKHLLIDVPSVDKEKDDGKLLAHKAFWNYPKGTIFDATITEMVFVKNVIKDGDYMLNLQIASFENDASPSKPILYKILESS
ncbi:cyclase family protein [Aquimarina sp. AD1]|uniref:cyclase family protein n=1 Tax=Aquimarina TaxID=290174 RepID=UPI0004018E59|nr:MULTISPECIES: cyclase family protein [Aquimarina]AXT57943.1 cyclase family protein [Aquimarina sp. AD1]RKN34949.1 cyclase family protein [Aquimarina sp. AD1]